MASLLHRRSVRWLAGVLAVVGLLALAGVLWLRASLPMLSGQQTVAGLSSAVEIVRDEHAIPHVFAGSEDDAYFGLGYVHAQDRLWQLELNRRIGAGRLSEVFGADTLSDDRLLRTLGLYRAAEANLPQLAPRTRAILAAYARGVNAYLSERHTLPPEFTLLGIAPAPWREADSLVWLKVMAWELSGQYRKELLRVRVTQKLGSARAAELIGGIPADWRGLEGTLGALVPAAESLMASRSHGSPAIGSNSWAVARERTSTGGPLLANDPHMGLSAPSLWYLAHLEAPGLQVVGATLPGLPAVILGRNDKVAWSFTNNRSDAQDFYLERLDPSVEGGYLTPDGVATFHTVEETIRIKGGGVEHLRVRLSRHGPIVSDVSDEAREAMPAGYALALRFGALEPDDRTLEFPHDAAHATSARGVLEAARNFHSPPQNIVCADAREIGFVAAGRVPVRDEQDGLRGLVPMPGWDAIHDWRGFLPFDQLPASIAPANGRLVTANQDVRPPNYEPWLGSDWASPVRALRITELLDQGGQHSLSSMVRIQRDVRSGWAAALLPQLLAELPADHPEQATLAGMRRWDYEFRAERWEPRLFAAWLRELGKAVYEDELEALLPELWADTPTLLPEVLADVRGRARWCDDRRTGDPESCARMVDTALSRALAQLRDSGQEAPVQRAWGDVHRARFAHTPFSQVPLLRSLFDVELPTDGANDTVNLGEYALEEHDEPFVSRYGPGLRAVYDLAAPEQSLFMIGPGQSGHPWSPYYRNLSDRWAHAEYVPIRTERAVLARAALGTLVLRPR